MLAMYQAGRSVMHRQAAGAKLASLAIAGTVLFFVDRISLLTLVLLVVIALFRVARIPWAVTRAALRPTVWMLMLLFVAQAWLHGVVSGLIVVLRLVDLLALATLVTLTTRASDMIAVLTRLCAPLERLGVSSARLGLMLSLTLRYIPLLYREYRLLEEASHARGGRSRVLPLLLPLLVRSLRQADALAEAIDARGFPPGAIPPGSMSSEPSRDAEPS